MKKCVVVLFALALVFTASYASAEGLYVKGILGATMPTDSTVDVSGQSVPADNGDYDFEFDSGWLFGAAVGSDLGNNVRVEGEIAYSSADVDTIEGDDASDFEVSGWTYLLNCYYDIDNGSSVTPFIGAGIGAATVEFDDDGDDDDDTVFAYQVSAGIGYAVNDSTTIELGYRYLATSDPEFEDGDVEAEYGSHNFAIGVRMAL